MIGSIVDRAETAAQGIARDAGITLLVVVLQFGAMLFIFGGIAWGLASVIAPPVALIVTGCALGLTATIVLFVKRRSPHGGENTVPPVALAAEAPAPDPLGSLMRTVGTLGRTLDVVAAGMVTRQLKRAPVATIAATVAVGVVMGMLADAADGD